MENLDKLTAAGLPVYDLNLENLDRKDWTNSSLGKRDTWPTALKVLTNSCILPIPHCAAVFWGHDLSVVYNLAWGKARDDLDGLGMRAGDSYAEEALSALRSAVRGRTCKVAARFFFPDSDERHGDAQVLLSTVIDENDARQGVLAQLLGSVAENRYMDTRNIDDLMSPCPQQTETADTRNHQNKTVVDNLSTKSARQLLHSGAQQPYWRGKHNQADAQQTQLFSKFAELLPNGLAILDKEAEAIFVNDGFFKLTTNKSQNEFRAWPESIHPQDYERVMDAYRCAFSSRKDLRIEFRCAADAQGEEGEWRLFLFRPLSDDPEAGFICAVVDITEIKQAEITQEKAALEAQERKEQQERFIDMVSHEIRNPLSAVMHLAEEVKEIARDIGDNHKSIKSQIDDILDAADTILLCVSHQNTLVDDILSFSKLDSMMLSLVPREVKPKWEFSRALKVFNSEFKAKGIKFHYAMDYSYDDMHMDVVIADCNRMKQVLVNLITNAIKFTARKDGDRQISVSMGASVERPSSYPPNILFFSNDNDAFHIDSTMTSEWGGGPVMYLMVAVKDTGIGINKEGQAKLFERFRQATPKTQEKYGGSGLGLFISRKLCQLHGGDIGVSSKSGEGSTFGFYFKVRRPIGSPGEDRPPFSARSSSSSSANQPAQASRPSYSRANSNLRRINELENDPGASDEMKKEKDAKQNPERPSPRTLTSNEGINPEEMNMNESIRHPPTEYHPEAHPEAIRDQRFKETAQVAEQVAERHSPSSYETENRLSLGETKRQALHSRDRSEADRKDPSDSRSTVLLVEDNLINQKVLRRQLQGKGFEVFVANNGQEAIDAVNQRGKGTPGEPVPRNYFDCILMDQEMPIKDGNAATIEIRDLQDAGQAGYSPILGVSANVREAQTKSMLDAGMDAVISKPYKVEDLVAKIKSLLPKSGNGRGGGLGE
ncbi:two component histidine kinase 1 [Karstenula rhodostoma CBS 690.94]|uniref:Two component histidine kinase 1 n=1 Tax=Karstenula rhodostoma CBS 690.94 TaxID=1392251 RepID=A0A9P4PL66_9PLEO|nr:two component histidine kinase 1 [Karstenula rhodostoma CBS 690.94]